MHASRGRSLLGVLTALEGAPGRIGVCDGPGRAPQRSAYHLQCRGNGNPYGYHEVSTRRSGVCRHTRYRGTPPYSARCSHCTRNRSSTCISTVCNTGVRSCARGTNGESCKVPDARSVLGMVGQKTFGFPEVRDTIALDQKSDSLYYRAEA